MNKAEIKTSIEDGGDRIDFLEEHLRGDEELDDLAQDPESNYKIRKAFLKTCFSSRMDYLNKHFGKVNNGDDD